MRTYKLFGTKDGINWVDLGEVVIGGSPQALNKALEIGGFRSYAAVAYRFWNEGTPDVVQRTPVVKWTKPPKAQLTVDDVLKEAEEEGVTLTEVPTTKSLREAVLEDE